MKLYLMKALVIIILFLPLTSTTLDIDEHEHNDNPDSVMNVYLLSPNTNEARNQWANLMQNELPKAGIGVTGHTSAGWDVVGPRTYAYPVEDTSVGIPTWDDGGYDMCFIGLEFDSTTAGFDGLNYDPTGSYSTETLSPNGLNFAYYENKDLDAKIVEYRKDLDVTSRAETAKEIQAILYEDQPYIPILNMATYWVYDSDLTFSEKEMNLIRTANFRDQWKDISHPTDANLVYALPFEVSEFVPFTEPFVSHRYMNTIFTGLYERDVNDKNYDYTPVLAASAPVWNDDYTKANVSLNPNAKFSNGNPVTAWDVVNTYRMHLTESVNSPFNSSLSQYFGYASYDSIEYIDKYTISFNFNNSDFNLLDVLSIGILDSMSLGNYTDYIDLDIDVGYEIFNRDPLTYGIGAGPFMYETIDTTNQIVKVVAVADYWNGAVASDSVTFAKKTREAVLADLASGTVHIADKVYDFELSEIAKIDGISNALVPDFGTQFLTVNMKHPVLGTGVDTPVGQEDPTKAAEAARNVRKAISHLVPRQTIIDDLLQGKGTVGTSLWPDGAVGYDSSLAVYEYSVEKAIEYLELAGYNFDLNTETSSSDTMTNSTVSSSDTMTNSTVTNSTMSNTTNQNTKNQINNVSNSSTNPEVSIPANLSFYNFFIGTVTILLWWSLIRKRKYVI